jgi:hypothetical protein
LPGNLSGRSRDANFERVIQNKAFTAPRIPVIKPPTKGVVIAVVAPGLGQVFQFHVSGCRQSHCGTPVLNFGALKVIQNNRQVGIPESQVASAASS